MKFRPIRFFQAFLIALFVLSNMVGPAYAQSTPEPVYKDVQLFMQDGWTARGKHSVADDFVIECPTNEVLDPYHPCANASVQPKTFDDLVLVCPGPGKALPHGHPCNSRSEQIKRARPDDFVLVCPLPGYDLPGNHPCNQTSATIAQFQIPGDYVMTCPTREVLNEGHPCSETKRK
jgi:hypothetical protein